MQIYYVKKPFKFELREEEMASPGPREVIVEPRACGVCGWDVITAGEVAEDWMGIGHEVAGVVAETGDAVENFSPGDRVIVENSTFCGRCAQCKRGNVVHCQDMAGYRSPGAFAEKLKVVDDALYPAEGLDFEAAALAEPLTVAIDMVESAEIPLAGTVAVFGPGPIGLMIARLALLQGASRVYLTGHAHSQARWRVAEKIGVTDCIYVDERNLRDYFARQEPDGVDRVLITAPPATIPEGIVICRFGGIVAYNGIEFGPRGRVEFDANAMHFSRIQLRGVHSVPNLGWPQAVRLLSERMIDPELFISHTFPFDKVPAAVRFAAENRTDTVKVMVDFS